MNLLNEKNDVSDGETLSEQQKQGIYDAIKEIELGKGISNDKVISKIREK